MKKLVLTILAGILLVSCSTNSQKRFTLKGQVSGLDSQMVYLRYRATMDSSVTDSVKAVKGAFSFSGSVNHPTQAHLQSSNDSLSIIVYLENADIEINGALGSDDNLNITGSKTQNDYDVFQEATASVKQKRSDLIAKYQKASKNKNDPKVDSLEERLEKFSKEHRESYISLLKIIPAAM